MSDERSGTTGTAASPLGALGQGERWLAALGARLAAHGLVATLARQGLRVRDPQAPGCCAENPLPSDLVTCHAFDLDGGRPWFFTSDRTPIGPVGELDDAVDFLRDRLTGVSER